MIVKRHQIYEETPDHQFEVENLLDRLKSQKLYFNSGPSDANLHWIQYTKINEDSTSTLFQSKRKK